LITAVDSNVLIDVFLDDKLFGRSSAQALRNCIEDGAVVISGIVFVETMPLFGSAEEFDKTLSALNITPVGISIKTFVNAASAWKEYRQHGGKRERMVADFLIAAHALTECDRLLTRDRGFYRKYFKKLAVVEPH
jgi:predicted nucleic acid-binding protein